MLSVYDDLWGFKIASSPWLGFIRGRVSLGHRPFRVLFPKAYCLLSLRLGYHVIDERIDVEDIQPRPKCLCVTVRFATPG